MTNSKKPLISILMATHNRADLLLQRSIPSILRQSYGNWELIIRGDGAGRDTEFVINSFKDPRIHYKNLPRLSYDDPHAQWCNGGHHALNDALNDAKGDIIAHLDDDDAFLPHSMETLSTLLMSQDYDIVYGRAWFETNEGWMTYGEAFDMEKLQEKNLMVRATVMYNRSKWGHFRYDKEVGHEPADWHMWKRFAASKAQFGFTEEIVAIHYAEQFYRDQVHLKLHHLIANKVLELGWYGFTKRVIQKGITKSLAKIFHRTLKPHLPGSDLPGQIGHDLPKPASNIIKLNLGSGVTHRLGPDWIHIDLLHGADVRRDVRKGLPYFDNSCSFIYSEHFIEHLSADATKALFKECYRVLKPGGVIRVATPDLEYILERYHHDWSDQALSFDHQIKTAAEMLNASFYRWEHKFLYDEETLRCYLEQSGSWNIERCGLGNSRYPELCHLETRPNSRLTLEGAKR